MLVVRLFCLYIYFLVLYTFLIFLLLMFQVAAYDTAEKKMAFFDPSRAKDFLFISGTKVRLLYVYKHAQ